MNKIAILSYFLLLGLPTLAFAQEGESHRAEPVAQTDKPNQDKTEPAKPDNGQPFEDIQDRTLRMNQDTTDSKVFTPNTPFSQQSFVPDISLVLDASYVFRDMDNSAFGGLKFPAFFPGAGEYQNNGFNLNYGELALASTVDPFFDLMAVLPFTPTGVEIEEAYINSRNLPYSLQLKAGKFRSSWGRLNSQHEHFWDFVDPPVVYTALFGGEQLNETGVQINWLAPLDTYLLLGAEILQGENEGSFGTKGFRVGTHTVAGNNLPNVLLAFAKTSFDIGDVTLLGGLSYAQGGTKQNEVSDDPKTATGFDGFSRVIGADLTLKYFLSSYTYLSWQSEWLYRNAVGNQYTADSITTLAKNQAGLYSQLTWRFAQQWKTGIRYDVLYQNDVAENNTNGNNPGNLARYSAMLEYDPTEFSRIRLQYNHDRSKFGENVQPVNEVFLQMNMAIGAHGAHAF